MIQEGIIPLVLVTLALARNQRPLLSTCQISRMSGMDSDSDCTVDMDIPDPFIGSQIKVHGAGLDAVNGIYTMADHYDGVGRYTQIALWRDQHRQFSIWCRSAMISGHKCWFISILDQKEPDGTDKDFHFYFALASVDDPDHPPENGWTTIGIHTPATGQAPTLELDTVVVKPVIAAYKEMLFSEQFSDVAFLCPNGEVVHAHKSILAASSPYFNSSFQW